MHANWLSFYLLFFRFLADGYCFYGAISVRQAGNNSLIIDIFNNGKKVHQKKHFAYYELVFVLARELRDCQNSVDHKDLLDRPPVKGKAKEKYDLLCIYNCISNNC